METYTLNLTKLITLVMVVGGAIALGWAGRLDSQAVVALLAAALGYVFGNGEQVYSRKRAQAAQAEEASRHGG